MPVPITFASDREVFVSCNFDLGSLASMFSCLTSPTELHPATTFGQYTEEYHTGFRGFIRDEGSLELRDCCCVSSVRRTQSKIWLAYDNSVQPPVYSAPVFRRSTSLTPRARSTTFVWEYMRVFPSANICDTVCLTHTTTEGSVVLAYFVIGRSA